MTETMWPAPHERRGSHVQHSWRCPRSAPIVERVKRLVTNQALVVEACTGCEGDDAAYRLSRPEPPEAA